jgi:hypothetical protein
MAPFTTTTDDHVFWRVAEILAPYRLSWEYQAAGTHSWPEAFLSRYRMAITMGW